MALAEEAQCGDVITLLHGLAAVDEVFVGLGGRGPGAGGLRKGRGRHEERRCKEGCRDSHALSLNRAC